MASSTLPTLRRALLYVPASSPQFLNKASSLVVDNVTYDLEDSVTQSMKPTARSALQEHLYQLVKKDTSIGEVAVRINAVTTPHAADDIKAVASLPSLDAIVVPKVNSAADLALVEDMIHDAAPHRFEPGSQPIKLLALIESAKAVMDLRSICAATPNLKGLIFAAEDYERDVGLRRSSSMAELIYARSAIVTAARAFKLESAIDAVCTLFRGAEASAQIKKECRNGQIFGFTGKQCIHPTQVPLVQSRFSPIKERIEWATRVVVAAEKADAAGRGAWTMDNAMVDAPVVATAHAVLDLARRCGTDIDAVREKFKDQTFE